MFIVMKNFIAFLFISVDKIENGKSDEFQEISFEIKGNTWHMCFTVDLEKARATEKLF